MELNENLSQRAKEDYDLVLRAMNGEQKAYAILLQRYKDSVNYMILKMVHNRDDADDLSMEAFGKAFHNLEKYAPDYAFSTWLYKIAINNTIDFIRKKRVTTLSIDADEENNPGKNISKNIAADIPDPEEKYIRDQRAKLMHDILDKLQPRYKKLVELRYFDELSYEEIAILMQLPLGTVKNSLFRARDFLYEILIHDKDKI
ncbi:MAG: sigma-70 family RNA polymerase sigma factor [Fimbriimonadaceae bacterium]|nr:sigma-70 family RNA polymerase sigma factor [Chitinophagales bacterium]